MDEQNQGQSEYYETNTASKVKDIEEKQNLLKDRVLLIGKNLIDTKEEDSKKITELKRDVETLKDDVERMKTFLETISNELSKFARKEDLEILSKQAKMFQPLNLIKRPRVINNGGA